MKAEIGAAFMCRERRSELVKPLAEVEKDTILDAIIELGGVKQAAESLKIPRRTIYRKLQEWNIMGRTWRRVKINRIIEAKNVPRVP